MADEIEERLFTLRGEINSYTSQILNHISSIYTPLQLTIDLKNDPRNILKILKSDINEIMNEINETTNSNKKYLNDILECQRLTEYLEKISNVSLLLKECEEIVLGNDIMNACIALSKMEELINLIPTDNPILNSGLVYTSIIKESKIIKSRFNSRLRRLLQDFIQISRGRIVVHKSLSGILRSENTLITTELKLEDVWSALVLVSGPNLEEIITKFLHDIWIHIIFPLWKEKKLLSPRIKSTGEPSELVIEFTSSDSNEIENVDNSHIICRMKFSHLLELIEQIFGFLYSHVFTSNEEIIGIISSIFQQNVNSTSYLLSGNMLLPILRDTLITLIPKLENEIDSFQTSIEQSCLDFEKNMILYGFFREINESNSTKHISKLLSHTVKEIPNRFLEARRIEILSRARTLVLGDYHNTMLGTGDAQEDDPSSAGTIGDSRAMLEQSGSSYSFSSLPFESCQVSLASCRLLKLVHEVMKQACSTKSSSYATVLYQTARDCLEIFAAVVQSKFSDIIETVPRMGAVFYNDCCYIAHNATLITHLYRQDLGKTDTSFGFVDFIPRFRAIGERVLQGHVEEQKKTLLILLSRINIHVADENSEDQENNKDTYGVNNEEAAGILVKHMGKLKTQWQTVLQDSVYNRLAGYLLEVILRSSMKPVLDAKYISESTATDISRIYKIIQKSKEIFLSESLENDTLLSLTGSWNKFCSLTELLECNLSEISEWLPKKKFISFTGQELTSLVKALFEDSSKRQAILTSILELSN